MKQKLLLCLFALVLIVGSHVPVEATHLAPLAVDDTRDMGDLMPGDGVCDNGEGGCSLRAAIEEANVFGPSNNTAVEIEIVLSDETFVLEKEVEVAAEIVLYGNDSTISGAGGTRLFAVTEKGDFSLAEVTLIEGMTKEVGGAIYNAGTVQLEQCAFFSNNAKSGGAIYNAQKSTLYVFGGSGFAENRAEHGGAIHNAGGYTLVIEGLFYENRAFGDQGYGGAIYTDKEGVTDISWSTLVHNRTTFAGGAIQSGGLDTGATLWMHDSTVANNRAYRGGGLASRDSDIEIRRSTFSENVAAEHGGGLYLSEWYAGVEIKDIVNSTISNNIAGQSGGGIHLYSIADVHLSNVTITQNVADDDGDRVGEGGGIFENRNSNWRPSLTMRNTIVADNVDRSLQTPDCAGVLKSYDYNLIGVLNDLCKMTFITDNNQAGTMDAPLDPMLDVLQPAGSKSIHPLLPGSPAIDAGNVNGCEDNQGTVLTWDQPGTVRPLDGDGDESDGCDIGAVEYIP